MDWKAQAVKLMQEGELSWRQIAAKIEKPPSTVSDYLRKQITPVAHTDVKVSKESVVSIETNTSSQGPTIIYIPDCQVKPGVDVTFLKSIGEYVAKKKPDVIVCAGDFADMESLSSYDKGKKSAEGKRVSKDIESAIMGMSALLNPIKIRQRNEPWWKPRMVLTLGNHEERIMRHVNANPELAGFLGYESLKYEEMGWEVYDFLEPVVIGGVTFIHYFPNPMSGKPYGGSAANILQKVGCSVVQGHKQCLDVATRTLHNGSHQWSIIAGASYDHNEDYKGYTGNRHWRGIVVMHNVKDGGFDPLFVSTEYLKQRYAKGE